MGSKFCNQGSEFCSELARRASEVFFGILNYRRPAINPANFFFFLGGGGGGSYMLATNAAMK